MENFTVPVELERHEIAALVRYHNGRKSQFASDDQFDDAKAAKARADLLRDLIEIK